MVLSMRRGLPIHLERWSFRQVAFAVGLAALLASCGNKDDDEDDTSSAGGTGGVPATGGQRTGGSTSTGGSTATGGRTTGGGGSATGGADEGGEGGEGGGDVGDGGVQPIAGAGPTLGGASSAGAAAAGAEAGAGPQGGAAPQGGAEPQGGATPQGGTPPEGGVPQAGAGAGGVLTGGAGGVPSFGGTGGVAGATDAGAAGQGGAVEPPPPTTPLSLYVACADSTGSIQQYAVDREAWTVTQVNTFATGVTNSWLTLNGSGDRVFVASRTEGRITTMSRDTTTGALTVMNAVPVPMEPSSGAGGAPPTGNPATQVVALDPSEQYLLAANYSAHYVYVYGLEGDGAVGNLVESANDGLSSHQIVFVPGSTRGSVLVPYRGSDTIVTYRLDNTDGSLVTEYVKEVDDDDLDATTGPRHLVFHPTEPERVYSLNEVSGTIDAFGYDDASGSLTLRSSISSVPPDYTDADKFASEIAISPSGRFIFASNRYSTQGTFTGEGSLGVFAVDPDSGELTAVAFESSHGALPRHFMLSPDGATLVVGNQNSNNIAVFSVNTSTGELTLRNLRDVCNTPFFVQVMDG